jgi:epsilon-lactone hydrolase
MPHVFQILAPFVPEANRALERAAGFVHRVTMRQAETAEMS